MIVTCNKISLFAQNKEFFFLWMFFELLFLKGWVVIVLKNNPIYFQTLLQNVGVVH
jgi:hypothetical protein